MNLCGTRAGLKRSPTVSVACVIILNVPFVVFHPHWSVVDSPLLRSLAINVVLFLAPGLPLIGAVIGRGWLPRLGILWVVSGSLAVILGVVGVCHLMDGFLTARGVWNGVWLATNSLLLLNHFNGGPSACGVSLRKPIWLVSGPLFLGSYLLYYYGALFVVPPLEDHDFDVQMPCYGVLTRFEPLAVTDYGTVYDFSHPVLLNFYVGASFLCFDELAYLEHFDASSRRARSAEQGVAFEPYRGFVREFAGRVVGTDGMDYLVDPALANGSRRVAVRRLEHAQMAEFYEDSPHRLQTRTPNLFLGACTVALLGGWISSLAGSRWLGFLAALAYGTSPEIFVRSSYGGYFAISNFAAVMILMSVSCRESNRTEFAWATCFLAGGLAAFANHKLIMLPAAVVVWEFFRRDPESKHSRIMRGISHPVVLGFVAATAVSWARGLSVDAGQFWQGHVRRHFVDRFVQLSSNHLTEYPDVLALWQELWQHTGYVVLPMGFLTLLIGLIQNQTRADQKSGTALFGLWSVWVLLAGAAFSVVDWRQTKHLMPLMLVLFAAPAVWSDSGRGRAQLVGCLLTGLIVWNVSVLFSLATNFEQFSITPGW